MFLLRDRVAVLSGWIDDLDETSVYCAVTEGNFLAENKEDSEAEIEHFLTLPLSLFDDVERPWVTLGAYLSVNVHADGVTPIIYKRLLTEAEVEAARKAADELMEQIRRLKVAPDIFDDEITAQQMMPIRDAGRPTT